MGVMLYLLLVSGLIVFTGAADIKNPQLIWIIAFIGSFSQEFSFKLLEKLMGSLKVVEATPSTPTTPTTKTTS